MIDPLQMFYAEAEATIPAFNSFADKHSLSGLTKADHICYKCSSKESFENIRTMLESQSEYMYQSIISKRRIAYIKMKKGIKTTLGTIFFLELSDQKPDGSQFEGFDHIEVYPTSFSYNEMVGELEKSEKVIKVERPHHTTHDVELENGFIFRCTAEQLIEKIKLTEM